MTVSHTLRGLAPGVTPGRLGLLLAILVATPAGATPPDRRVNVILMIADGCGPATVTLGREVAGERLALDDILTGTISTTSAGSRVTDSAAAATALASGVKTGNGMIGVDANGRRVPTLLERARERGFGTGLVAKTAITDATPAAFSAHAQRRSSEDSVAVQQIDLGVDVLLGGGRRWFLPPARGGSRKDTLDLIARARARGYSVATTRSELERVRALPLLGLFAGDDMSYTLDRDPANEPSLPEMARQALILLARHKSGFFLMIEGSLIDHAGHANDAATHARELLEYDATVREVLEFARRDRRTLVVCTADHETGGLGLGRRIGERSLYELRPEALRGVTASTKRMTDSIRAGVAPESVVVRYTGVPLDSAEAAILTTSMMASLDPGATSDPVTTALGEILGRRALLSWTTGGHTAVDAGLYAFGPGSERFRGSLDNTDVAHRIAERMGFSLAAPAARLAATPSR